MVKADSLRNSGLEPAKANQNEDRRKMRKDLINQANWSAYIEIEKLQNLNLRQGVKRNRERMGCTSPNAEVPRPRSTFVEIEFKTINQYIDQIPLFIIQKLKQKFDYYCDHQFQLSEQQFLLMYTATHKGQPPTSISAIQQNFVWQKLYQFFTDFDQLKLIFKIFITKYAILTKCDTNVLSNLLYFLYSDYKPSDQNLVVMTKPNYENFTKRERKNFGFEPTALSAASLTKQQFHKYLVQSGFLWEDSRRKFLLIDKDDIPFEAITRALIDMDVSDFVIGQEYYVLSSTWFERWSYYYQGASTEHTEENYKSTKLIKQRSMLASGKKRKSFNRSSTSKGDLSILDNSWLIQRPNMITYEDIQGEFKGELKENIKANNDLRIVSKSLWEMFKKTMPAERQLKRTANSPSTLDLYPKNIYYLKTDKDGKIIDSSLRIIQMSLKKQIKQVSQFSLDSIDSKDLKEKKSDSGKTKYYFMKNFGDNLWSEQKQDTLLGRCSVYPRFFVVETTNKPLFIENYFRNKKSIKNICYGDKVYKFFTFTKKVMPAFIIRMPSDKSAVIHYLGYNFRYENEVKIEELCIEEEQAVAESNKKQSVKKVMEDTFSFKGIANIGNTCFINSVIQCLIATPILEQYFCKKKFKEEKQPLLHQISELAASLLSNKKISPIKLKQAIDMELVNFRGNNQHDAQQFFLQLVNRLNQQTKSLEKQQETVFEYLFKGKVQSSFECYECQNMTKKQEDLLSVSLPIPEPEYNTYSIFVFPIYQDKIKKIVLRLHRTCKVNDYIVGFEERLGRYAKDYIFTEIYSKDIKIRKDLLEKESKQLLISNAVSPSSEIQCFQRFQSSEIQQIYDYNKKQFKSNSYQYFDYLDADTNSWLYGRFMDSKDMIEVMNQQNSFSLLKKKNITELLKPLGDKTRELSYKKIINRKFNEVLQKMQFFGYYGVRYMIAYPKEVTFSQLQKLINLSLQNYLKSDVRNTKRKPYYLRIFETNKQTCIYCQKTEEKIVSKDEVRRCCKLTEEQLNTPVIWVARQKQYSIMVDWISLDQFNQAFGQIEIDSLSSNAEKIKASDKVEVEDCLKLYQKPENLEMLCEKCKHRNHRRAETMKSVPNILVLHMQEYRVTQDMSLVKMDVNLKWVEFLDITKYTVSQKGTVYELYAYVRHHGTNQSGHYTCAIKRKHPFENKKVWVNFDDELTEILDNEQKNINSAYLLFFKRVDMPNSGYVHFAHF